MDVRCGTEGCEREVKATGLCMRCYKRQWRIRQGIQPRPPRPPCRAEGCETVSRKNGWCLDHQHLRGRRYPNTVRVESVEFNGITFRRYPDAKQPSHRRYYAPGGQWIKKGVQSLHQEVWKAAHGPIPAGWEVHHINGVDDNSLENLECMPRKDHEREHSAERSAYGTSEKQLAHLARIRHLTVAWHRSPAGREWHREHARKSGFIGNRKGSGVQSHNE